MQSVFELINCSRESNYGVAYVSYDTGSPNNVGPIEELDDRFEHLHTGQRLILTNYVLGETTVTAPVKEFRVYDNYAAFVTENGAEYNIYKKGEIGR